MTARGRKAPLYRKVNSRTHGVAHGSGGKAKHDRNTKTGPQRSMFAGRNHGLDHTPLYRFLLSRVGQSWDDVYSEASDRLLSDEAIWHLVSLDPENAQPIVRIGENSFYSGLIVDGDGILQKVDPTLSVEHLNKPCPCCTHTFNGKRFTRPWLGYPARALIEPGTD